MMELMITGTGQRVWTHREEHCSGACPIHRPSKHHMRHWGLNWRSDTKIMERVCCHGVGHPDPDSVSFGEAHGKTHLSVHGCDGCCTPPDTDLKNGDLVKARLIYDSLRELD